MPTHHAIIGGGPAATNAIETIRQFDGGQGKITLISDEPAHARMALPYWLSGEISREHTMTGDAAYFEKLQVQTRIGTQVTKIDPAANKLSLSDGNELDFDTLLIATGSSPVGLPVPGSDLPGVGPLWTLAHTEMALQTVEQRANPRVVMIGSGFIGFIMLNAMHKRHWQLAVVERESHVLPRMLSPDAATVVDRWLGEKGVDLHCGTTVSRITESQGAKAVELVDGTTLEADLVIIATGVHPNVALATACGIGATEGAAGGIEVNDRMQTNFPHIYAGGDVARGPALYSDQLQLHAIQPTAVDHGRVAGANMAGQDVRYPGSLAMNILDTCGLQCASFGNWSDPSAEPMNICNADGYVFRSLLWTGDQITGAVFLGRANDMGMLTDVGMIKGIMQTQTALGPWKQFLARNPFDIRRPYVASGVAKKLVSQTLLGRPAPPRQYHFGGVPATPPNRQAHALYVGGKGD